MNAAESCPGVESNVRHTGVQSELILEVTPEQRDLCNVATQTSSEYPTAPDVCESEKTKVGDTSYNHLNEDERCMQLPLPVPFPLRLPLFECTPKTHKVLVPTPKSNLKRSPKAVDNNRLPQMPRALKEGLHYFHIENEVTGYKSKPILVSGVKQIQPAIETVVKKPKHIRFNLHNDYPHGYCIDEKRFDYHGHNRKDNHMNEWTSHRNICEV